MYLQYLVLLAFEIIAHEITGFSTQKLRQVFSETEVSSCEQRNDSNSRDQQSTPATSMHSRTVTRYVLLCYSWLIDGGLGILIDGSQNRIQTLLVYFHVSNLRQVVISALPRPTRLSVIKWLVYCYCPELKVCI